MSAAMGWRAVERGAGHGIEGPRTGDGSDGSAIGRRAEGSAIGRHAEGSAMGRHAEGSAMGRRAEGSATRSARSWGDDGRGDASRPHEAASASALAGEVAR